MFTSLILKELLGKEVSFVGALDQPLTSFSAPLEACVTDITWIRPQPVPRHDLINNTNAGCIVCDEATYATYSGLQTRLFILCPNPQQIFSRLLHYYAQSFADRSGPAIHPTAIIHPEARIGNNVRIGAYSVIDACSIGDETEIGEYVRIYKWVTIGRNCLIREYCTIGGAGFGIFKNEHGDNIHMPHVGSVQIEDNVLIFPYTNVDRGTLGPTRIGAYTAIDHYCHIGHNSQSGRNNIITADTILCGGARIGDNNWLGVKTIIREKLQIGSGVITGAGSVVVKPIPDGQTWVGNPAREISISRSKTNS